MALTLIHDPAVLLGLAGVMILATGSDLYLHFKRVFRGILFFNLTVSSGILLSSFLYHRDFSRTLQVLNLRVFDLALAASLFASSVDLHRALSFSKTLTALLTLSVARISSYKRLYQEFRDANESRSINPTDLREPVRFIHARIAFFFMHTIQDGEETGRALVSRGFSID